MQHLCRCRKLGCPFRFPMCEQSIGGCNKLTLQQAMVMQRMSTCEVRAWWHAMHEHWWVKALQHAVQRQRGQCMPCTPSLRNYYVAAEANKDLQDTLKEQQQVDLHRNIHIVTSSKVRHGQSTQT